MSSMRFTLILVLLLTVGCVASKDKNQTNKATINQLELQEDLQRFYTRFTERVVDSVVRDETFMKREGLTLLREYALYDTESLKIVTSPFPIVNFLDMLVFIKLNKMVIHDYWIPQVYGPDGDKLYKAFEDAEKDLELISTKFMKPGDLDRVNNVIQKWRAEHPHQVRVEKIRLSDFTKYVNVSEEKDKSFSFSHIFVDTDKAVEAVDQMVLVANRGIFLAQQVPMMTRLQMRIGVQEVVQDSVNTLQSAPEALEGLNKTRPLINDLIDLSHDADVLVRDTHSLLSVLPKKLLNGERFSHALNDLDSIVTKADSIITKLEYNPQLGPRALKEFRQEIRSFIWFIAFILVLVGTLISLVWWTGSYITKRLLLNRSNKNAPAA